MKHIKSFNESTESDRIYNILSSAITDIRNVFIEFEDSNDIKYNLSPLGSSFSPNSPVIDNYIKSASFMFSDRNFVKVLKDRIFTLKCVVILPYEKNNTDLTEYGENKYQDMLVCHKRLESMGYECSTKLERYLPQYTKAVTSVSIPI